MFLRLLQGRALEKERWASLLLDSWQIVVLRSKHPRRFDDSFFVSHSWFLTYCCFQKQAAKELPSKPVDILSEAAMRNAYYTCHNVQVTTRAMIYRLQCNISNIKDCICWLCGWTTVINEMLSKQGSDVLLFCQGLDMDREQWIVNPFYSSYLL